MDIQQSMLRSYHTFAKSHPPKISDFFNTHRRLHSLRSAAWVSECNGDVSRESPV
jgi:hypothetical protein